MRIPITGAAGMSGSSLVPTVSSSYFGKEYFAPRPRSEEMRNYVLDLRGMNEMPPREEALEVYLKRYFSSFFK